MASAKEMKGVKKKGPYVRSQFEKAAEYISQSSNAPKKNPTASGRSKKYKQTLAEAEIDLLYAQYLQMAFLESEAKRTLVQRSYCAVDTFRKLCCLILQYASTVWSQTFFLQVKSILAKIYEHIQNQEDILKPLIEIIPTLRKKYRNLAEAVYVVKNNLHVKYVLLPESSQEDKCDVIKVLQEMQAFIEGFFGCDPQYREIISSVGAFKNYVDSGRVISDALKRGLDLLAEGRELYFSEASLALSTTESSDFKFFK